MSILNDINNFDPDNYDSSSDNDEYETDSSVDSSDTDYDEYSEDDYSPHNFKILSNQNNRLKNKLKKVNQKLTKEHDLFNHLEKEKSNLEDNMNKMIKLNDELNTTNTKLINEIDNQKRQNFFYLEIIGTFFISTCVGALYLYKASKI